MNDHPLYPSLEAAAIKAGRACVEYHKKTISYDRMNEQLNILFMHAGYLAQMKLTPWFEGTTKPVRPGMYQRRFVTTAWARWDGTYWYESYTDKELAEKETRISAIQGAAQWRGLANEPT